MSEHDSNSTEHPAGSTPAARDGRKQYQKPSFRSEQVFETLALQCGKISGTSGACSMVKMAS